MLIGFNSRRSSRKLNRAAAEIQQLETRALLAGNVLASINNSATVSIKGDNAANDITVAVDAGGMVTITGNNGTTINGNPDATFDPADLKNLRIDLRGGADKLTVEVNADTTVSGYVRINTGTGKDVVSVVTTSQLTVSKGLSINLGSGDDALSIQGAAGLSLGEAMKINGGSGNDAIAVVNEQQATGLTTAQRKKVDVSVNGGAGDDQIALDDLDVGHNLTVSGGGGNDKMAIGGTTATSVAGSARIRGGDGKDTLSVSGSVTIDKRLALNLGAGADDLVVVDGATIRVTGNAKVKGGPGTDNGPDPATIATDFGGSAKVTGFEGTDPMADDLAAILAVVNGLIA